MHTAAMIALRVGTFLAGMYVYEWVIGSRLRRRIKHDETELRAEQQENHRLAFELRERNIERIRLQGDNARLKQQVREMSER